MLSTLGIILVLFSLPGLLKPAEVVRNAERIDSGGGKAASDPEEWTVTMTRVVAGAMLVVGIGMIAT